MDPEVIHEDWLSACRVDDLLSRLGGPPPSVPLVVAILERLDTGSSPPLEVIAAGASGLWAPQWDASGEVVHRQIGILMQTIIRASSTVRAMRAAEVQMEMSAAVARLSLQAWRRRAEQDPLTGLRNGFGLEGDLRPMLEAGEPFQMAFIEIDGLKKTNDAFGHDAGHRLIQAFGQRLGDRMQSVDGRAYRLHGDEFIVVLDSRQGDLGSIMEAFESSESTPFSWGVAQWPSDDPDVATVQRRADQAMYSMKQRKLGRGPIDPPKRLTSSVTSVICPLSARRVWTPCQRL